jgi:pyruvate kinase
MLSGETAIGSYPVEAVEMMNRIALATERQFRSGKEPPITDASRVHETTQAVVYGAARIARQLDTPLLVVATRSGATAFALSQQRLFSPVLALSQHDSTLRRMCLYWGMHPVRGAPVGDAQALKQFVDEWGRADGCLQNGDRVVVVAGTGVFEGTHNSVEVHEV